jgi:hypothetical protein
VQTPQVASPSTSAPSPTASVLPDALPVWASWVGGAPGFGPGPAAAADAVVPADAAVVDGAPIDGGVVAAVVAVGAVVVGGGAAFTTITPCIAAYPWIVQ